jgi:hypothetical protein
VLLLALLACSKTEIGVTPQFLDWGEVDFQQEMGTSGYEPQTMIITNTGEKDVDIQLVGFPSDRLLLGVAQLASDDPPTLPTLPPTASHQFTIGVQSYELGEQTTLVEGSFDVTAEGVKEPITVNWQYVPIRDLVEDSGG